MKIMLIVTNCAKNYACTMYQSLNTQWKPLRRREFIHLKANSKYFGF